VTTTLTVAQELEGIARRLACREDAPSKLRLAQRQADREFCTVPPSEAVAYLAAHLLRIAELEDQAAGDGVTAGTGLTGPVTTIMRGKLQLSTSAAANRTPSGKFDPGGYLTQYEAILEACCASPTQTRATLPVLVF
jgi:hypothetical protein